jgi:tol-pal system protein YbgF
VASAANKEHQQMMADIRMLQEQTALLRAQLSELRDVLKAVGTKIDEQAGVSRKAFADQKLLVDTISSDLRVVREKVDDNNVRVSSIAQEIEALRLAVAQPPAAAVPPAPEGELQPGAAPTPGGALPTGAAPGTPSVSPTRLFEMAWADYVGTQYDLAVQGFSNYIRSFPKSDQAGEAQYYIGEAYYAQGRYRDAVAAYERVIAEYPSSKKIPAAYYKRGQALNVLGQTDQARESWEFIVKNYPNTDEGRLAKQRLDQMSKREEAGTLIPES